MEDRMLSIKSRHFGKFFSLSILLISFVLESASAEQKRAYEDVELRPSQSCKLVQDSPLMKDRGYYTVTLIPPVAKERGWELIQTGTTRGFAVFSKKSTVIDDGKTLVVRGWTSCSDGHALWRDPKNGIFYRYDFEKNKVRPQFKVISTEPAMVYDIQNKTLFGPRTTEKFSYQEAIDHAISYSQPGLPAGLWYSPSDMMIYDSLNRGLSSLLTDQRKGGSYWVRYTKTQKELDYDQNYRPFFDRGIANCAITSSGGIIREEDIFNLSTKIPLHARYSIDVPSAVQSLKLRRDHAAETNAVVENKQSVESVQNEARRALEILEPLLLLSEEK